MILAGGKAQQRLALVPERGHAVAAAFLGVGHPFQDDAVCLVAVEIAAAGRSSTT
jgi:hypothetical protein